MTIDIHGHLGRWYFPTVDVTSRMAERTLAENGVDMLIVSSSYALRYDLVEGNRRLAEDIRGSRQIKGYVVLNPNYPDLSLKEMEKYAANPDFVGYKIHPEVFHHRLDTPQGMVLCEAIADSGKPLLIHTFGSSMETPMQVVKPIEAYPSIRIILAHSGGYDWNLANDIASLSPNLYSEICCTCTCVQKIESLIEGFGEDRVMFGSDYSLFDETYSLGMAKDADLTPTQRRKLMGENAAKLFGLSKSGE